MSKTDEKILRRGLKRMALALLTTALFAIAVAGLVTVAFVSGYWAVLLFFVSLYVMAIALSLLYAQGITRKQNGSQGESK